MKSLQELVRPNIWNLAPYSCARTEYAGKDASVFLDANENPYNTQFNRYPDPLQLEVKKLLAEIKGVLPQQIFLGNGSDEAIDIQFRVFCEPEKDNVVAISPTYGMYRVCADINNVEYRAVELDDYFQLNAQKLLQATDEHTKLIFLCSPNNPSGNNLDAKEIEYVISHFEGIIILDEAYIDFSHADSFRHRLEEFPNLVVLNTFSKAWGCAAIRLGMAFASQEIIDIYNKVKYPYNINILTQQKALDILQKPSEVAKWIRYILEQRANLMSAVNDLPFCQEVYNTDANFFLAKMDDALRVYNYLVDNGVIVRNRNSQPLCGNCLRITIGTPQENNTLMAALRKFPNN